MEKLSEPPTTARSSELPAERPESFAPGPVELCGLLKLLRLLLFAETTSDVTEGSVRGK